MIMAAGLASLKSIGRAIGKGRLGTLRHELKLQFVGRISSTTGKSQFYS